MSSSINTNLAAYYAQANVALASHALQSSIARLASGNAIVAASDNVAALAIGTLLAMQVAGLRTVQTNASQGISLLQVADGALGEIQSILQLQNSLALQGQSGSLTDADRALLNQQFVALSNEIDALATDTTFNGVHLLDGSLSTGEGNSLLRTTVIGGIGSVDVPVDYDDPLIQPLSGAFPTAIVKGQASVGGVMAVPAATFQPTTGIDDTSNPNGDTDFNDTTFVGTLSRGAFKVTFSGSTTYIFSYTINGDTYQGSVADVTQPDITPNTSIALDDGRYSLTITISGHNLSATPTYTPDAAGAANLQADLNSAFAGATAYALHSVATTFAKDTNGNDIIGSAIRPQDTTGTLLDGFDGSKVNIQTDLYTGGNLPPISGFSATGTGASAVFSVLVNGVTYSTTGPVGGDQTTLQGSTFGDVTTDLAGIDVASGLLTFFKGGNSSSNDILQVNANGITSGAKIDTVVAVQQVVDALNNAFGSVESSGGLLIPLGLTDKSDVIVTIANSQTSALFDGASLDISSRVHAAAAATAVAKAINTVTATRAGVGAFESRFNFASAALQSSVQNQDAARGLLLDTDIAAESISSATSQVKLQAGIAVLAQANQQLKGLLKLIG